jgi:hypothetical protein
MANNLVTVAGVQFPDTTLCNAAVDLLAETSPTFLYNHCIRTYVFGSLAVKAMGRTVIDEEIAFCGSVLHDLGLVPAYAGENRFEVDGADAARAFCEKHKVPPARSEKVWEAIAFHTSPGIAPRRPVGNIRVKSAHSAQRLLKMVLRQAKNRLCQSFFFDGFKVLLPRSPSTNDERATSAARNHVKAIVVKVQGVEVIAAHPM